MKWFRGHLSVGRITVYGANAMHWGVNVWTRRWGYVCFRLPLPCYGKWWPLYLYVSPNATPWAATFILGGDYGSDHELAPVRRKLFGHNFNVEANRMELYKINNVSAPAASPVGVWK